MQTVSILMVVSFVTVQLAFIEAMYPICNLHVVGVYDNADSILSVHISYSIYVEVDLHNSVIIKQAHTLIMFSYIIVGYWSKFNHPFLTSSQSIN